MGDRENVLLAKVDNVKNISLVLKAINFKSVRQHLRIIFCHFSFSNNNE